jgi:hypothetical protein
VLANVDQQDFIPFDNQLEPFQGLVVLIIGTYNSAISPTALDGSELHLCRADASPFG